MRALVSHIVRRLGSHRILVYAGRRGFMGAARAGDHALEVASASAAFTALKAACGVLIDIGSTTTDLVRFGGGRVQYQGYTDGERLRSEELVYTGAIRTPIMAVADRVPFALEGPDPLREKGARCAPAAALAYLVKACPTPE